MRYRLQRHDGTDCSATMVPITVLRMVPIQRYRQNNDIELQTPIEYVIGYICKKAELVNINIEEQQCSKNDNK